MKPKISIGNQSFSSMRERQVFYVDKTCLIKEWWESEDSVTLITRPRRFGKTLNMSMLECFFSARYAGRADLFEGLSIWDDEAYRELQGTYPVIFLTFAGVKANNLKGAKSGIVKAIADAYYAHVYLKESSVLNAEEKKKFDAFHLYTIDPSPDKDIDSQLVCTAIGTLSMYLERYYGKKVLIFLDEYDTPLQEAYVSCYWKELITLIREMFNTTFKTNPHLHRAIMTGITRVSKESIFSDLNHLKVITVTSEQYATCFGFTENEVFSTLETRGLSKEKENIKFWYDGFIFGNQPDIYNPWSITNYLDEEKYAPYWASTSSNTLVSELIRHGDADLKMQMEDLLAGKSLEAAFDEQIIFDQLGHVPGAVWSLLMASGYLKPVSHTFIPETCEHHYLLKITNFETLAMFKKMISHWFPEDVTSYKNFKKALLLGDLDYMNEFMNDVSKAMFSSFDSGNHPSEKSQPERFYHGFVLGLVVDLADQYHIRSNRESGFGRYDVIMEPKTNACDAIIMEFKVFSKKKDKTLEQAVKNALKQIEDKAYDTDLLAKGIPQERIRHYGFAFEGKTVLIGQG